ncbi:hypothetical protein IWW37_004802 [Coemansia sp. RSA 2050]|nr:hypothetical protein IWW37_004802 [Coemansia sp. RSA 2050]KAJ2731109.1 hypothetical protein IW152_004772 [Coemansia sp. BCRC 34962]
MAKDNISNDNSGGENGHGIQTEEQSFEALLRSASHNQAPKGYNVVHLVPEAENEARTAKWSALLIGKVLVDDKLVPIFAPGKSAVDDNNKAKASDNSTSTAGTDVGKSINVDSTDKGLKAEGGNDEAKAKKEGGSAKASSDSRFFLESSLPKPYRVLKGPNAPMTMDYRPERLNVVLDINGVCTGVSFS